MMLCKDCVHYEVCKDYVESALDGLQYNDSQMNGDDCEFFKDRSRFLELPCKIGDTVYYFNHVGTIYSQKVLRFIVNSVGVLVDSDVMFDSNLIGNKFFLTREEAEQALKEREKTSGG